MTVTILDPIQLCVNQRIGYVFQDLDIYINMDLVRKNEWQRVHVQLSPVESRGKRARSAVFKLQCPYQTKQQEKYYSDPKHNRTEIRLQSSNIRFPFLSKILRVSKCGDIMTVEVFRNLCDTNFQNSNK